MTIFPFRHATFIKTIEKWLVHQNAGESKKIDEEKKSEENPDTITSPLDFDEAVREYGGDRSSLVEVMGNFATHGTKQVDLIRAALGRGDVEKGSLEECLKNFGEFEKEFNRLAQYIGRRDYEISGGG